MGSTLLTTYFLHSISHWEVFNFDEVKFFKFSLSFLRNSQVEKKLFPLSSRKLIVLTCKSTVLLELIFFVCGVSQELRSLHYTWISS